MFRMYHLLWRTRARRVAQDGACYIFECFVPAATTPTTTTTTTTPTTTTTTTPTTTATTPTTTTSPNVPGSFLINLDTLHVISLQIQRFRWNWTVYTFHYDELQFRHKKKFEALNIRSEVSSGNFREVQHEVVWIIFCPYSGNLIDKHSTNTRIGTRAFSVAAPTIWNSLPLNVRDVATLGTFQSHLKTHFFSSAYNI